jgi:hypothetical protein
MDATTSIVRTGFPHKSEKTLFQRGLTRSPRRFRLRRYLDREDSTFSRLEMGPLAVIQQAPFTTLTGCLRILFSPLAGSGCQ